MVSESVLLTETLTKLHHLTAQAIKMDGASWIENKMVQMDDLYTEPILVKVHNTPTTPIVKKLKNYSCIFTNCEPSATADSDSLLDESSPPKKMKLKANDSSSLQVTSERILITGGPGMGKTSQCKKITWDWAVRSFTYFHLVFFVCLKLAKVGDSIENIIIDQNSYLKGLKITELKLRRILELSGKSCLLILDGLDEHFLDNNGDVSSIIRKEKHLDCNIIVTTRSHESTKIEQHFQTIIRIEGFSDRNAKAFASKMGRDETAFDGILKFIHPDFQDEFTNGICPIILSVMCSFVDGDSWMDTMSIGDIFFQMITCLYKKFTIRKEIKLEDFKLTSILKSVGKLAWNILLSGNHLLKRADVTTEVGPDAFDYGLLIGSEDGHRLIRDPTADIYVTFPHRNIQLFFAAFYFVLTLCEEKQIETVYGKKDRALTFLKNQLFLQFCLWFLHTDKIHFSLKSSENGYTYLTKFYIQKQQMFSAFDVKAAHDRNDQLLLKFLTDICPGDTH